jgi:hypothetical protein
MSLTRRQIRLLTISAGDAERLPDDDDTLQDSEDLTVKRKSTTDFEINKSHIDRLRKGVKIKSKSHVVDNLVGKKIKAIYKKPTSVIKNKNSGDGKDFNIKDLVNMGMKKTGPISIGNKLRKKLRNK